MIAKTPKETDKYEAFDLVANAWEELDLYQRSADDGALENATQFLKEALEQDPHYFKADYLSAITTYFTDPSRAADQFQGLMEVETAQAKFRERAEFRYWLPSDSTSVITEKAKKDLEALNWEIRFNLAAARLEATGPTRAGYKEEVEKIREEFETLKKETKKDSPLNLLARSVCALGRALIGEGTASERYRIWWKLWIIDLFPWRIDRRKWRIRLRKIEIDKDTMAAIRKILRYVKNPKLWEKLSRPDESTRELTEV